MFLIAYFLHVALVQISRGQNLDAHVDIKTLSELPLDKLLQVQNSFKIRDFDAIIDNETLESKREWNDSNAEPIALALKAKEDALNRHGHDDYGDHGEKSKIQSVFQLSVTALAFLSFGGYLLCLIVNAIRSKQVAVNDATATQQQVLAAIINAQTNRQPIRITRVRRRRPRRPNANRRPNRVRNTEQKRPHTRHRRDAEPSALSSQWPENLNTDDMYYALIALSEAYKTHHTTDFKRYNATAIRTNDI